MIDLLYYNCIISILLKSHFPFAFIIQVWRPVSGLTYTLAGENTFSTTGSGFYTFTVAAVADYIFVQSGDIIGWYTASTDVVMYKDGGSRNDNNYIETISQPSVGDTITFSNRVQDETYAIQVTLSSFTPTFSNLDHSLTFYINEMTASSTVYDVDLTDANIEATATFSIDSVSPALYSSDFTIDASTGVITTVNDITTATTYTLTIMVTEQCGNQVNGVLIVDVLNRSPQIHSLPAVAQISESAAEETLLNLVNVTDPDGDTTTCVLASSPSGPFITKFISSGGTLYNGVYLQASPGLDYSSVNSYELTVSCSDPASASAMGILYVYVTQNQVPVISNLPNTTTIFSNMSTSSKVFTVLATDSEGDQMSFAVACVTVVATCPFSIYSDGSMLLTTSLLDTSTHAYELDISVSDALTSSGTHRLTIFVHDLNVAPLLTNLPAQIQIREDSSVGTVIFDTSVNDANGDTSFSFTATISPTASASLFNIDAITGQVSVANTLNYLSQTNNYSITIDVSDGQSTTSSILQIETIDVNQTPVLYQTNYKVEVSEGNAGTAFPDPGYNVYDPDADTLVYSFGVPAGTDSSSGFNINSTDGTISFSIAHDMDNLGVTNLTYVWLVVISDPEGLSTTATLTVSILDANDNVPYFSSWSYSAYVFSDVALGTTVLTVSSTDIDVSSSFRQLEYSIHNTNLFAVDNSGNVIVFNSLTTHADTTESMGVRVRNPGTNSYDSANVNIYIRYPVSDDFFDIPGNIAWVTLVCVIGVAAIIGLAYLAYMYLLKPDGMVKPLQVAPKDTNLPPSRSSRPMSQRTITPSDIRAIENHWQPWNIAQTHSLTNVESPLWAP